jgi:hypothetical protein
MKRYPIGLQDFSEVRTGGYLYVDKTRQIHELTQSGKYFFLSRPRRFGKSLLLSTLKYFFLGRKDLFEGLWVAQEAGHDWEPYPVLHFSFSSSGYKDIGLEKALLRLIDEAAGQYNLSLQEEGISGRFRELIHTLGAGPRKVVLLIDEYDKPLTDYLNDYEQAQANRDTLKSFFSVLKDADAYLRFVLITGVSKFSKVSLFSDLNNLEDLTINPFSASLTGYTQAELEANFSEEIDVLAKESGVDRAEMLAQIREWYNGYRWWGEERLYNPFSILNLVKSRMFRNYWWSSGTPTFLLDKLKDEFQFDLREVEAGSVLFESYTLESLDWKNLLFQTGYLTLKDYDPEVELYTLGFPNREVKASMYQHLLATFRHGARNDTQSLYAHLKRAMDAGDLPKAMDQIDKIFSTIPYQVFDRKREGFFHAVLHLTFQGLGLLTQSEVSTANGRVDCVVRSKSGIYVLEFKLDDSAEAALTQIRDHRYGSPYLGGELPVIAVGISFSSETKTVAAWEEMPYEKLLAEG